MSETNSDKLALVKLLLAKRGGGQVYILPRSESTDPLPLSFQQERLWFHYCLDKTSSAYVCQAAIGLPFACDPEQAQRATGELVRRHEILRTTYSNEAGQPQQHVHRNLPPTLSWHDLRALESQQRAEALRSLTEEHGAAPFDLERSSPLRLAFVRLDEGVTALLVCVHHIVSDAWSIDVLLRDLYMIYTALADGRKLDLPSLPIQYADYCLWQRRVQDADRDKVHLTYWTQKLAALPELKLFGGKSRRDAVPVTGRRLSRELPPEDMQSLTERCRSEGVSLYVGAFAAFNVLLNRYSGSTDIVVGTPVTNRDRPETAMLIGLFLNMLTIRTSLAGSATLREALQATRTSIAEALEHQEVPFEKVVAAVGGRRTMGKNPVFQITFTLNPPSVMIPGGTRGLANALDPEPVNVRFDMEVSVAAFGDALRIEFCYDDATFATAAVQRMMDDYLEILRALAHKPVEALENLAASAPSVMSTSEFLLLLRERGIRVQRDGDRLKLSAPTGAASSQLRTEIGRRKSEILALMEGTSAIASLPITKTTRQGDLPLSPSQQRLWFLNQLEPDSAVYNIASALRLTRPLNVELLRSAVQRIYSRHEALQTVFSSVDGRPSARLSARHDGLLQVIDLRSLQGAARELAVGEAVQSAIRQPFDLASGPLIRVSLIHLTDSEQVLVTCVHHIVSDAWSMELFGTELTATYVALQSGTGIELPPLPVQFVDYVRWQADQLSDKGLAGQLQYWLEQLKGPLPVLQLPTDRPRPPVQTFNGQRVRLAVDAALTRALKGFSLKHGASLYMTLLAAFEVLLYRYTGQTDIIVGSPIAGRSRPELENLIGFFVNNLVLRTSLDGDPSLADLVQRVRKVVLSAHANQDVPFDRLVEELRPERDVSHSPIFQVLFNSPTVPHQRIDHAQSVVQAVNSELGIARFDLTLEYYEEYEAAADNGVPEPSGLTIFWEFNSDLFDEATIRRMQQHYVRILQELVRDPLQRASQVQLLSSEESFDLLHGWNRTSVVRESDGVLHKLFERRAALQPDAVAVVCEAERSSFAELDRRANRIATELRRRGVVSGAIVAICMDRSIDMVASVLGILKAGAAYLPLDPTHPPGRLKFILDDSNAALVVTQTSYREAGWCSHGEAVFIDEVVTGPAGDSPDDPAEVRPGDLAYVIYTSGSTGNPKGVMVEHRAIVNFIESMQREPGISPDDVLLAITTLSFDIAGLELHLPLSVGAQVVLATSKQAADASQLLQLLDSQAITFMQATPATWRLLIESGWQGSPNLKVLCGGEAMGRDLAADLVERCRSLWNMYGPTETTVWSTLYRVTEPSSVVPVGKPIANTQAYVLDVHQRPVPIGVDGELYLGGEGVARGYLNRPELTAEKFLPNPFVDALAARIYRTGDLARFRADGDLEWIARADAQTKIRGFRIELGEIEATMGAFPGLQQAAAAVREPRPGDQRLAAYFVPAKGQSVDVQELQAFLRERLPEYMIPSIFVQMESLPLTPNAKVDRKALPGPDFATVASGSNYVAPETDLEKTIVATWAEVLGIARVGVNDNFFDLGGHSLLIVRLHSRLTAVIAEPVTLLDLFQYPTVAALVRRLKSDPTEKSAAIDRARERARQQLNV